MTDHDFYERLARIEERAIHRDEKLNDIAEKVDKLYVAFVEGKGVMKAGRIMVAAIGAAGGAAATMFIKLMPFTSSLPK